MLALSVYPIPRVPCALDSATSVHVSFTAGMMDGLCLKILPGALLLCPYLQTYKSVCRCKSWELTWHLGRAAP